MWQPTVLHTLNPKVILHRIMCVHTRCNFRFVNVSDAHVVLASVFGTQAVKSIH
jgi:hypothetical protein